MRNSTHLAGFNLWTQDSRCGRQDFKQPLSLRTAPIPFPSLLWVSLILQGVSKDGKTWAAFMVQLWNAECQGFTEQAVPGDGV